MILEFKNIEKSFGEKSVLRGISFKAESGMAFGLLGRNGAGKTTAIRILMGLFPADGGEILLDGEPIRRGDIEIGYLPEERGLYPKKIIMEQLVYFARLKGMSHADAIRAIDYWLDRLEMTEYKSKRLDTLSKGNQQKIQMITALVHDPQIVILDEPFSGLDPVNAALLKSVVHELIEKDKIVLFSSHQMSYIEEFCDSIAIINAGKVVISGDLHEIKRAYPRDKIVVSAQNPQKIMADLGDVCTLREDGTILIKLSNPDEKQAMMRRIVSDYDVDEVGVFEPSLNDIFVEYAGEQV